MENSEKSEKPRAERLSALARRYRVADIYSFGSRGREAAAALNLNRPLTGTSFSDLDIGIRAAKGVSLAVGELVGLTVELEDLFDVGRVDLVLLNACDPFLALDIIRGELLYTEDPLDQSRYELFVLRRAGDLLPLKRDRIKRILGGKAR